MLSKKPAHVAATSLSQVDREDLYCRAEYDEEDIICKVPAHEYANSPERRARYTKAAQRYLQGKDMVLLSTRLRGPFDEKDGWVNPWRSNGRRPARAKPRLIQNLSRSKSDVRSIKSSPKSVKAAEERDSLECHLPSPESLNQEPVSSQGLPYLNSSRRDIVKTWRKEIELEQLGKEDFWFSQSKASKKRKGMDESWLKSRVSKKAKLQEEFDSEVSEVDELAMMAASSPVRRYPPRPGSTFRQRRHTVAPFSGHQKAKSSPSRPPVEALDEESPDELARVSTPQAKQAAKHSSQVQSSSFLCTPSSSSHDPRSPYHQTLQAIEPEQLAESEPSAEAEQDFEPEQPVEVEVEVEEDVQLEQSVEAEKAVEPEQIAEPEKVVEFEEAIGKTATEVEEMESTALRNDRSPMDQMPSESNEIKIDDNANRKVEIDDATILAVENTAENHVTQEESHEEAQATHTEQPPSLQARTRSRRTRRKPKRFDSPEPEIAHEEPDSTMTDISTPGITADSSARMKTSRLQSTPTGQPPSSSTASLKTGRRKRGRPPPTKKSAGARKTSVISQSPATTTEITPETSNNFDHSGTSADINAMEPETSLVMDSTEMMEVQAQASLPVPDEATEYSKSQFLPVEPTGCAKRQFGTNILAKIAPVVDGDAAAEPSGREALPATHTTAQTRALAAITMIGDIGTTARETTPDAIVRPFKSLSEFTFFSPSKTAPVVSRQERLADRPRSSHSKHVTFADLPANEDEVKLASAPVSPTAKRGPGRPRKKKGEASPAKATSRHRVAGSPPPEGIAELDTMEDKPEYYGHHFELMQKRFRQSSLVTGSNSSNSSTVATTVTTEKSLPEPRALLREVDMPTSSPAPGAMAQAFIDADLMAGAELPLGREVYEHTYDDLGSYDVVNEVLDNLDAFLSFDGLMESAGLGGH